MSKLFANAATQASFPNAPQTPGHNGIIGGNAVPLAGNNDQFTHIQVPGAPDTAQDIFFPFDGHQPTTQEAATWSLRAKA